MDGAEPLGRDSGDELWSPINQEPGINSVPSLLSTKSMDGESKTMSKTRRVTDTMIREAITALTDRRGSSVSEIHSWLKSKTGDDVSDKDVRVALRRGLKEEQVASNVRGRFLWFGQKPDCPADKKMGKKASATTAAGARGRGRPRKSASLKAMKCGLPMPMKPKPKKPSPKKGGKDKSAKSAKGGKTAKSAKGGKSAKKSSKGSKKKGGACPGGKELVKFCASKKGGGGFFGRKKVVKKSKKSGKKASPKKKKSPKKDKAAPASTGSSWFGCGQKGGAQKS